MLEKPELPDERLLSCLRTDFGLDAAAVTFLPIGADINTAVYRAECGGEPFFVKLRRGDDAGMAVEIARLLHDRGIEGVIPPGSTRDGAQWAQLDDFTVSISPFITGRDGFDRKLSDANWIALGGALKRIHTGELPASISERLPRENFSAHWRDLVRAFQAQAEAGPFPDDAAAEQLAAMIRDQQEVICSLVKHAERLGQMLQRQDLAMVPCHADIHGGNVLIDDSGQLYIVDWDTFMLAPKERDLMFIGGGIGASWRGEHTERPFYAGYGAAEVDPAIIAYYRCERIIQDIAEFGKYLLSPEGGADRAQAVHYFASNFRPGSTIDIALASVRKAAV